DHRVTARCLKARGEIDGASPPVRRHPSVADPAAQDDAPCGPFCDRYESGQGSGWVSLRGRSQMREGEAEPPARVGAPDPLAVRAGVEPGDVRNPRRDALSVQLEVVRPEAVVAATDVEAEEGRLSAKSVPQAVNGVVQVRAPVALRRAEVQGLCPARIGRVEG